MIKDSSNILPLGTHGEKGIVSQRERVRGYTSIPRSMVYSGLWTVSVKQGKHHPQEKYSDSFDMDPLHNM